MKITAPYAPMGANKQERSLETDLLNAGWHRGSQQHYAKVSGDREVAIDQHIGHFCVGVAKAGHASKETLKYRTFTDACSAALKLEAELLATSR